MTPLTDRPRLIQVAESEPDWAPELARQFTSFNIESVSLPRAPGRNVSCARPALLLVTSEALRSAADDLLAPLCRTWSPERVVAVLDPRDSAAEWFLRELGVDSVADAKWPRRRTLQICRKLLRTRG